MGPYHKEYAPATDDLMGNGECRQKPAKKSIGNSGLKFPRVGLHVEGRNNDNALICELKATRRLVWITQVN